MMRIMAVHQINKLHSEVSAEFNNSVICPCLLKMVEDPVPNIRFNVSKTIGDVAKHMSNSNLNKLKGALKKMADNDTDFDAQFFAE
jgi:serine/threonine-protein phosphatase 2A regulatory subunit A